MDSLLVALNVVFPLLVLISIGYLANTLRWISHKSFTQLNSLVFNILLPCVLFENTYSMSIGEIVNPKLIIFALCSVSIIFLGGIPIAKALTRDPLKQGVALQAIFRSNFVLYGLPIVQSLYAKERLGPTTIMITIIVPVFNILAVIALEMFRSGKVDVVKIIINICKNPLIIGSTLGILFSVIKLDLPQIMRNSLSSLSGAATPVALIVLGGTFRRQTVGENKKILTALTVLRLIAVPGVMLCAAALLGFRDVELLTFVALFGSPSAVSSFSMAQQMGSDSELAGQNLLFTTVFSILTIFMWVSLFNYLSLIT